MEMYFIASCIDIVITVYLYTSPIIFNVTDNRYAGYIMRSKIKLNLTLPIFKMSALSEKHLFILLQVDHASSLNILVLKGNGFRIDTQYHVYNHRQYFVMFRTL